jgi:hypothetical protein
VFEKDEGQRAYWRGDGLHDNPYPRNSLAGREWDAGYWDAVDADENLGEHHRAKSEKKKALPSAAFLVRAAKPVIGPS